MSLPLPAFPIQLISSAIPMLIHEKAMRQLLSWMTVPLLQLAKDEETMHKRQQQKQSMKRNGMGTALHGMDDQVNDVSPDPSIVPTSTEPRFLAHPHSALNLPVASSIASLSLDLSIMMA